MDASGVLRNMRRWLGDVAYTIGAEDPPVYSDAFLLEYVQGAADYLVATRIVDQAYTVDVLNATITPEPSAMDGLLLASLAASDLMSGDLSRKIRDGELGLRFRTGLNEISTVEASRRVVDQAQEIRKYFTTLVTNKLANRISGAERTQ